MSVCPIRHPLWLSMSCGSQGNTIQGFSPHKCGQKSSCSAFNAVVATFPYIFLSPHHPCTFTIHVTVTRSSWKITLFIRIHTRAIPSLSEEVFLLGLSSHSCLASFTRFYVWHIRHYSLVLGLPVLSVKTQGPIHYLDP